MSTPSASSSTFFRPNPPLTRIPSHPSPLANSVRPSPDAITIENADYDAFDALLHSIFAHTQSSSFSQAGGAVCLRVESAVGKDGLFRVFPYEATPDLVKFEENVRRLNPAVAVKLKGAAVHAVLTRIAENDRLIALESNTHIQILPNISALPSAEKDQRAAFIADPQDLCLVLWSFGSSNDDGVAEVVDLCKEMEDKLIKYVWRTRGVPKRGPPSYSVISNAGTATHTRENSQVDLFDRNEPVMSGPFGMEDVDRSAALTHRFGEVTETKEKEEATTTVTQPKRKKNKWNPLGWWKLSSPTPSEAEKEDGAEKRKHVLLGPFYAGTGAGLALYFITSGISVLVEEYVLDGNASRFGLIVVLPVIYAVSIFFCLQLVGNLSLIFGPVAQYHENSMYYSALPPPADPEVDNNLPHITIQLPVYKESLELTIAPSIFSIKKAMQTYARQGGTSAIFVCDDGLRLISEKDRNERIQFYANHNIGWVARPRHDGKEGGFKRRGKFKKASNMNYGLTLSMKLERHLQILLESQEERDSGEDLEEKAMNLAIEEIYRESGYKFKPEASNPSSLRMGAIILIIDADTVVPEDCFRDAAREMFGKGGESVGIIQHESDVMQVAHHYFENGITHFTRRINKCISYGCANGEVAPFVGHNAFLRWSAVQDAGFLDPYDFEEAKARAAAGGEGGEVMAPERKMWSESNVSEDFDLALRLLLKGYTLRWATYSNGGFKEGVSLTVVDELARWQKYAYGCDEIIFNPLIQWWRKGPISKQLSGFLMSKAPVHYKIGMTSYMFSYYGIAAATVGSILNYLLLGLAPNLDRFYLKSFEILLACVVVFPGLGNIGFTLLEYRIGHRSLLGAVVENLRWVPFFVFFFGGLSIHLSTAILAHMFSYDMTWGSTGKEVEKSTFWDEVPRILRGFRLTFTICIIIIAMMIIMSTNVIPFEYQIPGWNWALIIPVSLVVGCHALVPIVLNPWLMKFSY